MLAVLLTIHIIACVALVFTVMLQRSEGGALGMGGGGTGGLISGRGAASVLVKTTMGLAFVFFVTSITMTRINNDALNAPSALEQQQQAPVNPFDPAAGSTTTPPASTTTPSTTAPAATAPAPAVDPLAPKSTTPAPSSTTTAPAPAQPAPATTTPTTTAPAPQNGGSNN